jgi:hypothetical protein
VQGRRAARVTEQLWEPHPLFLVRFGQVPSFWRPS